MHIFDSFVPFFEILVIAISLYFLISFFWKTRSRDLILGSLAFLAMFGLTILLHLPILYTIMKHIANVAAVAVIVVFQPELRVALSKLSFQRNHYKIATDKFLEQLTALVFQLAATRRGALIVIENKQNLEEFARQGLLLNADFSPQLLQAIFFPKAPLHDGAIIIRNKTVLAASVILPIVENTFSLPKGTGTRHLAALSFSQSTDALVIVVSEQTGEVSVGHNGQLTKDAKEKNFKGIFRSVFVPHEPDRRKKFYFLEWLKA